MGRITSNVGLITGIPIADTVEQLLQVAGAPRDILAGRNQGLQQQQLAVNSLSSRLLGLKFDLGKLKVATPFQSRSVTSQNEDVLTAAVSSGGKPPLGNFALRPAQTASAQQLISQRFETLDDIQQTGTFSFGVGGFVDKGISLDELNDGAGVARGEIKITDQDDNEAIIDLSLARSVDDVLKAINTNSTINVTASTQGDRFTLVDSSVGGGTFSVQEVNGGTTVVDLGLQFISNAVSVGEDVYGLHTGTKLSNLNDGNGVFISDDTGSVNDLEFTFRDDSTAAGVDLSGATTLGEVIDTINNDTGLAGRVTAAIAADGKSIELTDTTVAGAGTFSVANGTLGSAADDLGLTVTAVGDTISGNPLIGGLRDTLLSSFRGGQGLGTLGLIDITDRAGGAHIGLDLSGAETLDDIVDTINTSTANVVASINEARNGIVITDDTSGTGNLIVANNADATLTADALGLTVNDAQESIDSNSLGRQIFSEATTLSSLGITASDISITDSSGATDKLDLNGTSITINTIGDVISAINNSTADVTASINSNGDGIIVVDNAAGSETFGIKDINGTLAADLKLTRASEVVIGKQTIDGTNRFSVDLTGISSSNTSISLSTLNDGAGVDFSGDIRITDSDGDITILDLNGTHSGITTIGQFIDAINDETLSSANKANITASINSSGTGILLTDNSSGSGNLIVEDVNGTAAADLNILSTDSTTNTINGTGLFSADSVNKGALENVATRINDLNGGVTASVFSDGIGFRLQLVVDETGLANETLFDANGTGFTFTETSVAQDALVVLGGSSIVGSGVVVSSATNDFNEVIEGVDLTTVATSATAVEVTVAKSDEDLVSAVEDFVSSYNAIRSDLDELTSFNAADFTTGLLFGTNEALRVDTQLSRIVTDRFSGVGSFESLEEVGISVDDKGKLQLDKAKLKEAFAEDAKSLQSFFTDTDEGVVAKFEEAIERLAGEDNSLLSSRNDSLQNTIDSNLERIERFNESLDRQRETLLLQFVQLEQVIASLQAGQTALNSLQPLAPLVSTRS